MLKEIEQIVASLDKNTIERLIKHRELYYDIYLPNFSKNTFVKIIITLKDLVTHNFIDKKMQDITHDEKNMFIIDLIRSSHLINQKFHYLPNIRIKQRVYNEIINNVNRGGNYFRQWLGHDAANNAKVIAFIKASIEQIFTNIRDPQEFQALFIKIFNSKIPRTRYPNLLIDLEPSIRFLFYKKFPYNLLPILK